jgi:hypothetical protein
MTNNYTNIRNSVGKMYISIIMSLFMSILEIIMHDMMYKSISLKYYIPLTVILVIFIFLYRVQYGVNDKQYLNEMIEHHSMAILTSEDILKKTNNYNVRKLASQIIQIQQSEIRQMKEILEQAKQKNKN